MIPLSRPLPVLLLIAALLSPAAAAAQTVFSVPVTVRDNVQSLILTLAADPAGRDTFDSGLDLPAPPLPISESLFDARARWNGWDYFTDVRSSADTAWTYRLTYRPGENDGPIVLSWDVSSVPAALEVLLTDAADGSAYSLDMRQADSVVVAGLAIEEAAYVRIHPRPAGTAAETPDVAAALDLSPAYPNPFRPESRFTVRVATPQIVRVEVVDLLGRPVARLYEGPLAAGRPYPFTIPGGKLAAGTYLYVVTGRTFRASRAVTHLR